VNDERPEFREGCKNLNLFSYVRIDSLKIYAQFQFNDNQNQQKVLRCVS